jgi:TRAP-type C4-dicarboxylate transport system substrate-binding protein
MCEYNHLVTANSTRLSRRRVLKGAAGSAGLLTLAGCVEDGNSGGGDGSGSGGGNGEGTSGGNGDGDSAELAFTIGGVMSPPGSGWEGAQPSGHWEFERRVEEQSDGRIQVDNVAEGQICGELDCPESVRNQTVEVGSASIGNSSQSFPMNDIWMIPYTFPSEISLAHTLTQAETYEQFWVPFAQEFGVIPLWYHAPALRSIHIGLDRAESTDFTHQVPSDVEGMDCRRTASQVSGIALNELGMNPVSLSWADALQGLRSGTVDGAEAAVSPICAYGGNNAEALDSSIINKWTIHNDSKWANVEWLKSLSDENLSLLADVSKSMYEDLVQKNMEEIHQQRLGLYNDNPPEDSCTIEHDLDFTYLDDSQMQQWEDAIGYEDNLDLYSDILDSADQIGVDGEAFHEYLVDTAREDSVPSSHNDFTVDAWWDEYLSEM